MTSPQGVLDPSSSVVFSVKRCVIALPQLLKSVYGNVGRFSQRLQT